MGFRLAATALIFLWATVVGAAEGPNLTSASAIVIDQESGKTLWERNADTKRFPASTTKIMTALLLLERVPLETMIEAPFDTEQITGSSLYMKPGEMVTARDMLYALIVRSANDGAVAVANHISGSVELFAKLMNERAAELGCRNTHFTNPHGLNDENHVTSARDLAIIAREAMKHPEFVEASKTRHYHISRSMNLEDLLLVSRNKYLTSDRYATGIKTGWTVPAGRCFVGSAERDGKKIITVLLKGDDWLGDQQRLASWTFDNFERKALVVRGQNLGTVEIPNAESRKTKLEANADVTSLVRKGENPEFKVELHVPEDTRAPLKQGDVVGDAWIIEPDGTRHIAPLALAQDAVVRRHFIASMLSPTGFIFFGLMAFGAYLMRRKARAL